jgi:hypothetical protein
MPRRNPSGYTTPVSERANRAANAILQLVSDADGEALPGGELHRRLWRLLCAEFDDVAREAEADCEALIILREVRRGFAKGSRG